MSNTGGVYTWSQTSSANATADNTVNYAEGQAPSTLNDAGRAVMASVAKWRDDISGAIVTTGSATAYLVSSNQNFDSLADMNGQQVWFTPHITNALGSPSVTLNVDSLGAKPLRSAPNVELFQGALIQGTPYGAIYNNADGAWYLKSFYGISDFSTGDVKPTLKTIADPGWIMGGANTTIGNVGSGATFASATALALYTLIWNNVSSPTANAFCAVAGGLGASAAADWAGLKPLSAGWWSGHALGLAGGGGSLTTRALGSNVGEETHALISTEIPTINSVNPSQPITVNGPQGHSTLIDVPGGGQTFVSGGGNLPWQGGAVAAANSLSFAANNSISTSSNNTGGSAPSHNNMQPTIFVNAMIKL